MTDKKYNTIFHQNAKNLKEVIDSEFGESEGIVDAIITSPPYANLQDYGDQEDQVGEQEYENFLSDLKEIFRQCYEVAAEDATLWVITDTFKRNNRIVRLPFDIADEVENLEGREWCDECQSPVRRNRDNGQLICRNEDCGERYNPLENSWRMEDHIIWNKKRTRPWRRKGQLRNTYEHISMFSKSDDFEYNIDNIRISDTDEFSRWWVDYPERYNPKGKVPANVWDISIPKQGEWGPKLNFHPSPFPPELIERIVKLSTEEGDVVLDPFAGVGTTLAVAENLNRKSIGFELNKEFIDHYEDYIRDEIIGNQAKLVEDHEREETAQKIWTLRVHKYAIELYKNLIEFDDIGLYSGEIKAIIAVADPEMLTPNYDTVDVDLFYVTNTEANITNNDIQDLKDKLKSGNSGSGDYYELNTDINIGPMSMLSTPPKFGDREELYVYTGGNHHYFKDAISFDSWGKDIESTISSRQYYTKIPPLISNLRIRIKNPYSGEYEGNKMKRDTQSDQKKSIENQTQSNLQEFLNSDLR